MGSELRVCRKDREYVEFTEILYYDRKKNLGFWSDGTTSEPHCYFKSCGEMTYDPDDDDVVQVVFRAKAGETGYETHMIEDLQEPVVRH